MNVLITNSNGPAIEPFPPIPQNKLSEKTYNNKLLEIKSVLNNHLLGAPTA